MKLTNLAIGLTLLAAGTAVGVATQQLASADVSSGDRPILVPIETCRIADTRPAPNNVGPKTSPLAPGDTMTVSAQQAGSDCSGKIPAGASSLSLNVTALNATSNSFLTVWAGGLRPDASALNPAPGQRVFNAVTTELTATQTFDIYNNRGSVDVFVDINGYYENHNHDDRYPLATDVDAAVSATKYIPIDIYNDAGLNFGGDKYANLNDMGLRAQDTEVNFTLPPDYTAGTNIGVRFIVYGLPADTPCASELNTNWTNVVRPGIEPFVPGFVEAASPGAAFGITQTLADNRMPVDYRYTLDGTLMQPGDAVGFGMFFQSCLGVIAGIEITYM